MSHYLVTDKSRITKQSKRQVIMASDVELVNNVIRSKTVGGFPREVVSRVQDDCDKTGIGVMRVAPPDFAHNPMSEGAKVPTILEAHGFKPRPRIEDVKLPETWGQVNGEKFEKPILLPFIQRVPDFRKSPSEWVDWREYCLFFVGLSVALSIALGFILFTR